MFITFEGGEGSGKSTQARYLNRRLSREGIPTLLTHEPGGTPWGIKARRWLKWSASLPPPTELLFFELARAFLVSEAIRPGLEAGRTVICDRYTDSTIAYQGYGRGVDVNLISTINNMATEGLKPDLSILLDISPERGLARKAGRRRDRFEEEDIVFHRRVREGYMRTVAAEPERWLVIDATLPKTEIRRIIWERVRSFLFSANWSEQGRK